MDGQIRMVGDDSSICDADTHSGRMPGPHDPQEDERLAALDRLEILDTKSEQQYDDLTLLASHICGTPIALMSLVARERQWFKSKRGFSPEETHRDEAICAYTILQSDVFIVEDAALDTRFCNMPLVLSGSIRFYAGAPIASPEGHLVGSLCVIDSKPRRMSEEQKAALQVLGRQAAAYLLISAQVKQLQRNAQERMIAEQDLRRNKEMLEAANARLHVLANTDALTGLPNRRVLETSLKELCPDRGTLSALSVLMIDVDHFKRINDTFSHEAGDRVLTRIARLLQASTRSGDLVSRYGGEEFVIILPATENDAALARAEELRSAIAEDRHGQVPVTVSIGVATVKSGDGASASSLLLVDADRALYQAKRDGRNCVRSAGNAGGRHADLLSPLQSQSMHLGI